MNAPHPRPTLTLPTLNTGEVNAGLIFHDAAPAHWLIVLPIQANDINWADAIAWAKSQGGELPTRKESALVFANAAQHMQTDDGYWTSEPYAGDDAYAWFQWFDYGNQDDWHKSTTFRAFAVRRVTI